MLSDGSSHVSLFHLSGNYFYSSLSEALFLLLFTKMKGAFFVAALSAFVAVNAAEGGEDELSPQRAFPGSLLRLDLV